MAAFYGMVVGNREATTRTGSKNSGFKATCQSYDGSVITDMYYKDDELRVRISLADGSDCYGDQVFDGNMDELKQIFTRGN